MSTTDGEVLEEKKASQGDLKLYSMPFCPYAQRVRLVLKAKGIPYNREDIDLNNKPPWFSQLNPFGEVPVLVNKLVNKDVVVYESSVCCEYLEDAFPHPAVFHTDIGLRAEERTVISMFSKKVCPMFYGMLKDGMAVDKKKTVELEKHLLILQEVLKKHRGPFLVGGQMGMADLQVWPWFERMVVLEKLCGYTLPGGKFPELEAWQKLMEQQDAVQTCRTDPSLLVRFYADYRVGNPDFTLHKDDSSVMENLDHLRSPPN